jgi:hypothetical protein
LPFEYLGRAVEDRTRVLDVEGEPVVWADRQLFERLADCGFARMLGSKRRIHKLRLIVPVPVAFDLGQPGGRVLCGPPGGSKTTFVETIFAGHFLVQHKPLTGLDRADFSEVLISCIAPA